MIAGSVLVLLVMAQGGAPPAGARPEETATIRGRITEQETGQPVAGAVVVITRRGGTEPIMTRAREDGSYEMTGLAPGVYSGAVMPPQHRSRHLEQPLSDRANGASRTIAVRAGQVREGIDVALPRALAMIVRVVDEWGGPLAWLQIRVLDALNQREARSDFARTTDDRGRLRVYGLLPGSYIVCAEPLSIASPAERPSQERARFVTTCYPSAAAEADAQAVTLDDADLDGVEIRMRRSVTYSISGTVVDATGSPPPARAWMSVHKSDRNSGISTGIEVKPDGRFTISGLVPGDYALTAEIGGPNRPQDRRDREAAYHPVHLGADDVEGIVVATAKATDVAGRIVLEDPSAPLPLAPGSPPIYIYARLVDDPVLGMGSTRMTFVQADRTFVLDGLFGRRWVDIVNLPRGWVVRSIRYGGKEIIDTPVEFAPGGGGGRLDVVLSRRGAFATGVVLDDSGHPPTGGRVLMMPASADVRRLWNFLTAPVSTSGEYRIGPVRTGTYLLVALPPGTPVPSPRDDAAVAKLFTEAERVTLTGEEERPVDLRVVRQP